MKIKIASLFAATVLLCTGYAFPGAQAQQPAPDFAPMKTGADEGASRESRRQRLLEKFDLNHDGTLDDTEREKMRAAREEKIKQMGTDGGRGGGGKRMGLDGAGGPGAGVPGSGPGGLGAPGGPGGGDGANSMGLGGAEGMRHGMTDEQRQARRKRMRDRFDANHDGKLDDSERMQLREQMGKMGGGGGHRNRRGNWGGSAADGNPGGGAPGGNPGGGAPGGAPGGAAPGGSPN